MTALRCTMLENHRFVFVDFSWSACEKRWRTFVGFYVSPGIDLLRLHLTLSFLIVCPWATKFSVVIRCKRLMCIGSGTATRHKFGPNQ